MTNKTPSGASRKYWTRKLPSDQNHFSSPSSDGLVQNRITLSPRFLHKAAAFSLYHIAIYNSKGHEVLKFESVVTQELWLHLQCNFLHLYTRAQSHLATKCNHSSGVGLCTELFYAIIPTLFPRFLLFCYPCISFNAFTLVVKQLSGVKLSVLRVVGWVDVGCYRPC